jgi:GntR family transcriptional regulator
MRALAVQKDNPIPLYYQLAELIRERIASGEIKPGDQLSSARTISEEAGISRMTVRQALDYLERQGHLEVRRGAGTFVAAPKLTYHAVNVLGFTQEMIEQGRQPSSRVIEQSVVVPPGRVAARLAIEPDRLVVKIVRLRLTQDVPVLLETVFLPQASCPGLENEDLSGVSLYGLLEQRYRLRPHRSRQTLEATIASDEESRQFGIAIGTPMILVEGVTYGAGDQPIEVFTALFRGDRFQFELESHGPVGDVRDPSRPFLTPFLTEVAG